MREKHSKTIYIGIRKVFKNNISLDKYDPQRIANVHCTFLQKQAQKPGIMSGVLNTKIFFLFMSSFPASPSLLVEAQ